MRAQLQDADVVNNGKRVALKKALQWGATDASAARPFLLRGKPMFNKIQQVSKSDSLLAKLFAEAKEYAQVYVLARQRQKGCDGMGELAGNHEGRIQGCC